MSNKAALAALDRMNALSFSDDLPDCCREEGIPVRTEVVRLIKDMQAVMFPHYFRPTRMARGRLTGEKLLLDMLPRLKQQMRTALIFGCENENKDEEICEKLINALPKVKEDLLTDAEALYFGDPAARSVDEVLLCYPGFYAMSIFRVAHVLYEMDVPLLPRIMTEYAHTKTGIDIHAGAKIGRYFCMDHGTGIVIGETTVIGDHVKIYQGVTLGAKSFELDEDGNPVKAIKRHPNIGNNVVIYGNAVILGGNTVIGDDCIIGGNVWLTSSVPPCHVVAYKSNDIVIRERLDGGGICK
ncbi:MAG: serine acetyltransferase [Clostridiales bacterium]|jgi:serine O-acetyltransferase|nr:serine O-acetyltransferase [Eubacteriales bacterium]NLO14906.1 serine acetyltransferase [Clostridiales bacterium]